MSENAFLLCAACGHIKPAGVAVCEYCSGQQKAVSLEDLKLGLKGAQEPLGGADSAEEQSTKEEPPPVVPGSVQSQSKREIAADSQDVPKAQSPPLEPAQSSNASKVGRGGFIGWLRRILKF